MLVRPFSTIATVAPGTPKRWRRLSTRSAKPAGGSARAAPGRRKRKQKTRLLNRSMSTSRWLEDAEKADRDERQDEDGEHEVGERAVAVGDQRDETEPARQEHADDEQGEGDREPRTMGQRRAGAALPRLVDPLVDRVHRARSAFQQRREDHQLEEQV